MFPKGDAVSKLPTSHHATVEGAEKNQTTKKTRPGSNGESSHGTKSLIIFLLVFSSVDVCLMSSTPNGNFILARKTIIDTRRRICGGLEVKAGSGRWITLLKVF